MDVTGKGEHFMDYLVYFGKAATRGQESLGGGGGGGVRFLATRCHGSMVQAEERLLHEFLIGTTSCVGWNGLFVHPRCCLCQR